MMDSNITSHARSFSLVKYTNFWSTLFGVQLFEVMRKTATYSLELISVIFVVEMTLRASRDQCRRCYYYAPLEGGAAFLFSAPIIQNYVKRSLFIISQ